MSGTTLGSQRGDLTVSIVDVSMSATSLGTSSPSSGWRGYLPNGYRPWEPPRAAFEEEFGLKRHTGASPARPTLAELEPAAKQGEAVASSRCWQVVALIDSGCVFRN